jgi:hypothetical protein
LHEQRSTHDSLLCVAGDVGGHDCVRHAETVALEIAALDDIRDLFPVRPKLRNQTKGKKMRILDETKCARVVDRDTAGSMCGTDSARYDPHVDFTTYALSLIRIARCVLVQGVRACLSSIKDFRGGD